MAIECALQITDDTKLYLPDTQKGELDQVKQFAVKSNDSSNIQIKQARIQQIAQSPKNSPYDYYMNIQQIVKLVIAGETYDVQLDHLIKFS